MDFSTLKSKDGNDENNKIYMYQCVWQSKERWAMAKTVKDVMFRRRKTHEERLRNNPSSFWSVTRAGELLTPVTAQEREKKGRARQGTQRSPLCLWRKKKRGVTNAELRVIVWSSGWAEQGENPKISQPARFKAKHGCVWHIPEGGMKVTSGDPERDGYCSVCSPSSQSVNKIKAWL